MSNAGSRIAAVAGGGGDSVEVGAVVPGVVPGLGAVVAALAAHHPPAHGGSVTGHGGRGRVQHLLTSPW